MFKDRAFKSKKLIGISITAFVISTSVSWAGNDLFKNLADELLKTIEEEFKEETQKKLVPASDTPVEVNSREVVKQIQEGLNWFGYPAGTPDGLAGKKTRAAITELQRCWQAADPEHKLIPQIEEFGSLSNNELNFFKSHYYETSTMNPRIYFDKYNTSGFTACEYFEALVLEATGNSAYESGMPPGQCYAEGDKVDPLFYCTFSGGKKEVSVCEELDEDAESEEDRNTLSYNFGRYNADPEMYLYERIEHVFRPTENYTPNNVPMDTSNEFVFSNRGTRYVITADTWIHSKGRGLDGSLTVLDSDKVLAQLTCDEESILDNSWDGYTHAKLNRRTESNNICEGKYTGYALKNNVFSRFPEADAGYPWSELMQENPIGALYLTVNGSEEASYNLEGFDRSIELTKRNELIIDNGEKPVEDCFGDWCSVCDTWPGSTGQSCYTIHDVNSSGLMLAFDSLGRAAIHEECYPKLSYPCSFAGRSGDSVSVELSLFENNGSGATVFETGKTDWSLSCN